MPFCLTKSVSEEFLRRLRDGEITPDKLGDMNSEERHAYFSEFMGDANAKQVNALYESKLLLKNQQAGMINWAKTVSGIKPAAQRDIISKIQKMDKILTPENEDAFLKDLVSNKLGADVSPEEAQHIADLSKAVSDAKTDISTFDGRVNYGRKVLDLQEYVQSLHPADFTTTIKEIANIPNQLVSTLNFSAPFIHGWGMMSRPQFYTSFSAMFKSAVSNESFQNLKADIVSRETYPAMRKAGLRLGILSNNLSQQEESFIGNLLDKVPGIGASKRAYTGFLSKLRADVFDSLQQKAALRGEDTSLGSQVNKDIARVVNNFTGSANLGKNDELASLVPYLNTVFFSPRKLAATMQMFTNPVNYLSPKISPTARGAAWRNLIGSLAISATVLTLIKLAGGDVPNDPKNTGFGKGTIGGGTIDTTGSNHSYVTLLARLIENKEVTSKGKLLTLGQGYKPATRLSLVEDYARNHFAPLFAAAVDLASGSNVVGQKVTAKQEALNLITPISISDVIKSASQGPKLAMMTALAEMFGVQVTPK